MSTPKCYKINFILIVPFVAPMLNDGKCQTSVYIPGLVVSHEHLMLCFL